MCNWAVFLDRDGVINEEVEYLSSPDQLRLIPGAAEAIHLLNNRCIPAIVVTNQAGVARGFFSEGRVRQIHQSLSDILAKDGAHIDRFYYCPHHPSAGLGNYCIKCNCRKPEPGMLLQASIDFSLELSCCYMVGDKISDLRAGQAVNCKSILVRTGYGLQSQDVVINLDDKPDYIAENLMSACQWIIKGSYEK